VHRMSKRVGIVGHRYLGSQRTIRFVCQACNDILSGIKQHGYIVTAVSALAEGADTFFAEAAVDLGIPLEIVRPFRSYILDFSTDSARKRYLSLQKLASLEAVLDFNDRSIEAYEAAMSWIVSNSDLMVAVWDGKPARGPGGTGRAVQRAYELCLPWIHVSTSDFSTIYHVERIPA